MLMSHCINISSFKDTSTPQENEEAKAWSDEYLKLSKAEFEHLKTIVNSNARADYFNGAIRLFADGEYTDLYQRPSTTLARTT